MFRNNFNQYRREWLITLVHSGNVVNFTPVQSQDSCQNKQVKEKAILEENKETEQKVIETLQNNDIHVKVCCKTVSVSKIAKVVIKILLKQTPTATTTSFEERST